MLPIHPHPKLDEILSSWMVRLAMANGFKLHTFYVHIVGYREPIWNRDVDRHPPPALIRNLAAVSGHSEQLLKAMSLLSYEGVLTSSAKVAPHNPSWIIPLGVFHRRRRRDGMQFCPRCLAEDGDVPYFRRHWRLALFCYCERHGCLLQGHCPGCGGPISYHRLDFNLRRFVRRYPLSICWNCGLDFRSSAAIPIECADDTVLTWMQSTMNIFASRQGEPWTHSGMALPYYQGIMTLARALASTRGAKLHQYLRTILALDPRPSIESDEFAKSGISWRFELLLCVGYLLQEWPTRFTSLCKEFQLTRSRFSEYFPMMPWWLYHAIDIFLDGRIYVHSTEEIACAVRYLERLHLKVTVKNLRKYAGLVHPLAVSVKNDWRGRTG